MMTPFFGLSRGLTVKGNTIQPFGKDESHEAQLDY